MEANAMINVQAWLIKTGTDLYTSRASHHIASAMQLPPPPPGSRRRRARKTSTFHVSVFNTTPFPSGRDWAELPRDVISCILRNLDHAELLLGGAASACCSWRRAARDDLSLWRRIDMRDLPAGYSPSRRHRVSIRRTVRAAVGLSAGQCDTFFGNLFFDNGLLLFLAEQAPLLKGLHLIQCSVSKQVFMEAMKNFPLLEELEISLCFGGEGALKLVAEGCPRLQHFRLVTRSPSLVDDYNAFAIAKMHGLRSLHLDGDKLDNKGLAAILDNCPHLEYHNMVCCARIKMDDDLRAMCSRLKVDNCFYDYSHLSYRPLCITPSCTYQDWDFPDYYDASYYLDDDADFEDHERIMDIKRMRRYLP